MLSLRRMLAFIFALTLLHAAPAIAEGQARPPLDPKLKAEMQALKTKIDADRKTLQAEREKMKPVVERMRTNKEKMNILREKAKAARDAAKAAATPNAPTSSVASDKQ